MKEVTEVDLVANRVVTMTAERLATLVVVSVIWQKTAAKVKSATTVVVWDM
jgi:hypothetical protein